MNGSKWTRWRASTANENISESLTMRANNIRDWQRNFQTGLITSSNKPRRICIYFYRNLKKHKLFCSLVPVAEVLKKSRQFYKRWFFLILKKLNNNWIQLTEKRAATVTLYFSSKKKMLVGESRIDAFCYNCNYEEHFAPSWSYIFVSDSKVIVYLIYTFIGFY